MVVSRLYVQETQLLDRTLMLLEIHTTEMKIEDLERMIAEAKERK